MVWLPLRDPVLRRGPSFVAPALELVLPAVPALDVAAPAMVLGGAPAAHSLRVDNCSAHPPVLMRGTKGLSSTSSFHDFKSHAHRCPRFHVAGAHVMCAPLQSLLFAVCWLWAYWAMGPCVTPAFLEALWRFTRAFGPPPFALIRAGSFSPGRLVSFRGVILTSLALDTSQDSSRASLEASR